MQSCIVKRSVACFPSMGVLPPPAPEIRPSCIRHPCWGPCCAPRSQAGHHTHTHTLFCLLVPLGGGVVGRRRTLTVAPPVETPLVSHAAPIILPGFRAHIFHSRVAQFIFPFRTLAQYFFQWNLVSENEV